MALQPFLFSVGGLLTLLVVALVASAAWPARRWPRRLLLVVVVAYLALAIRSVPYVAQLPLVAGFHAFAPADLGRGQTRPVIVVLGGGLTRVAGYSRVVGDLSPTTVARVLEAARVYGALAPALVISSGGWAGGSGDLLMSEAMRDGLVQLGVPADAIELESMSQTTYDEARILAPRLRALGAQRFVLVTSDVHMRRSLATFRAEGIDPVPAPAVDPSESLPRAYWFFPTDQGLGASEAVAHEYVGIAWYALRGRIHPRQLLTN